MVYGIVYPTNIYFLSMLALCGLKEEHRRTLLYYVYVLFQIPRISTIYLYFYIYTLKSVFIINAPTIVKMNWNWNYPICYRHRHLLRY